MLVVLCASLAEGACAAATMPPREAPGQAAPPPPTPPQSTPAATAPDAAETLVTLRIGESVTPPRSTTVVTLTDVSDDSRCPTDATCVWAGDATVSLRIQPAKGPVETVALHLNRPDARSATAAGLRLRLERLEPAPQTGRPIERGRYLAAIVISE